MNNFSFLFWAYSACEYHISTLAQHYKLFLKFFVFLYQWKCFTSNNNSIVDCLGGFGLLLGREIQFFTQFIFLKCFQNEYVHFLVQKFTSMPYIHRCFYFVSSKNPYTDSGLADVIYCLADFFLKLVFYSSGANEIKVYLELFLEDFHVSVFVGRGACFEVSVTPITIKVLCYFFRCYKESA